MKTAFELIEANGLSLHGDIEHFAEAIRADEREACAKLCDAQMRGKSMWVEGARACAAVIRAEGFK